MSEFKAQAAPVLFGLLLQVQEALLLICRYAVGDFFVLRITCGFPPVNPFH